MTSDMTQGFKLDSRPSVLIKSRLTTNMIYSSDTQFRGNPAINTPTIVVYNFRSVGHIIQLPTGPPRAWAKPTIKS